jgi:hypothetical protein
MNPHSALLQDDRSRLRGGRSKSASKFVSEHCIEELFRDCIMSWGPIFMELYLTKQLQMLCPRQTSSLTLWDMSHGLEVLKRNVDHTSVWQKLQPILKVCHPRCVLRKIWRCRYVNTQLNVTYLLCWRRHVLAIVGHLQVTKMYMRKKLYSVR